VTRLAIHLVSVFVFCQASPSEEKHIAKSQNIVLRHLYLLLGYNASERERPGFYVPPSRLRTSPVFNSFLSNLPQLLDQNYHMGKHMLPTSLLLLHYSPCPQQHSHTPDLQHAPQHSLWFLEPHARRSWLMALIVILYKVLIWCFLLESLTSNKSPLPPFNQRCWFHASHQSAHITSIVVASLPMRLSGLRE